MPATPLPYLERMALVNRVFGDDIRFLGVYRNPDRLRISQPHVEGEAPAAETLVSVLTGAGFRRVFRGTRIGAYDAMTFRRRDL